MENIDLNVIEESHVTGSWLIKSKQVPYSVKENHFSKILQIEINNGIYKTINGHTEFGHFLIFRETDLIYNPQINFVSNDQLIENAIVTRLFLETEGQIKKHTLTLYFANGLELVLQRKQTINKI